jgi:hypothetical protein
MNAELYDLNIWSGSAHTLNLTAYTRFRNGFGHTETNTTHFFSISFSSPENIKEIEYLLDDLYLNHFPLTDYDEWVAPYRFFKQDTPESIRKFLYSLPYYDYLKETA